MSNASKYFKQYPISVKIKQSSIPIDIKQCRIPEILNKQMTRLFIFYLGFYFLSCFTPPKINLVKFNTQRIHKVLAAFMTHYKAAFNIMK